MARPIILGNSRLTVGLNEEGLVHDFYYPYVGLENLTTARSMHHKIGLWINGNFSWTDEESWNVELETSDESLIGFCKLSNSELGTLISTKDFVDNEYDFFGRQITISNTSDDAQEVRLFMHQVFEISRNGRADTAFYVPEEEYIMDYKGRTCLLISGNLEDDKTPFSQYAVGNYAIEGKTGTYMDAEDGELSGHNVEHGGVDSVLRFDLSLRPGESKSINYWIIASDTQQECENINDILKTDFSKRIQTNIDYWKEWLSRADKTFSRVDEKYRSLLKKSLLTIKTHTDVRGGVIASCDSSIYNYGRDYYSYVWPRDGAYAMWPLIRLGYYEEPKAYINFCADIATKDGYLLHKYQPDRAIGSTWHPQLQGSRRELAIQEDETAIIIIMLGELFSYSKDETFTRDIFERLVVNACEFLCRYIDEQTNLPHASYDLWEEKFLTTTYTTASVYRALLVASDLAETLNIHQDKVDKWQSIATKLIENISVFINPEDSGLRKGFLLNKSTGDLRFDNTCDVSSFYGCMVFGFYQNTETHVLYNAVKAIENKLLNQSPSKGSPRYENDNYFRVGQDKSPNPWIVTTLWIAQYYLRTGKIDTAEELIDWAKDKCIFNNALPEQIHPETSEPLSVTPLVWSHAEFINTVLDLTNKKPAN